MIYKLYCPKCDRTYVLCMTHLPPEGENLRFHIDGNYCIHLLDVVKHFIISDGYD